MRSREGQIEYFGKCGMSLLGAMVVTRVSHLVKNVEVTGLEYHFYDVVIDKYSYQDNVQVCDVIIAVLKQI